MDVIRAFLAELWKMFAADLLLTLGALVSLALVTLALRAHWLGPAAAPIVLAGAVLAVLTLAIARSTSAEIRRRSRP